MGQGRLGYACICTHLRNQKPAVFAGRGVVKKTIDRDGIDVIGDRALQNCRDVLRILQWNEQHHIRFFRLSSDIWPWMGVHDVAATAAWPDIQKTLRRCGEYARRHNHRLTFHPSHFVKLASPDAELRRKSMLELEDHARVFDLMGYHDASPENKINIHVGGSYGDKDAALARFAASYQALSDRCRPRLTVENDDTGAGYSVKDLSKLSAMCGIPIVFDFHHHPFNTGGLTEREAFDLAVSTWPDGIRPVVHWSESQPGRRPNAHSDFITGPIRSYSDVDVMIEAKAKEAALLRYRESTLLQNTKDPDHTPEDGKPTGHHAGHTHLETQDHGDEQGADEGHQAPRDIGNIERSIATSSIRT
jgi:UV DNA damage endonuclease